MEKIHLARWESKSGKYWVELYTYLDGGTGYTSDSGGGSLGILTKETAMQVMQTKVDRGYFLPDAAKTPMKRVS